ncbi:MAG: DUF3579 domain-containing protein [Thiohalomonadaceae bacterium]
MDRENWIIESVSNDGATFHPGDWIERISASLATYGADHRLQYNEEVQSCIIQGKRCLLVSKRLPRDYPQAYEYVMHVARMNKLRIQEDSREQAVSVAQERRE